MSENIDKINKKTNRIGSSLVKKLNLRMIGRLVSAFISMNILIILMSIIGLLLQGEKHIQEIINIIELSDTNINNINISSKDYKILESLESNNDLKLHPSIQKYLPIKKLDVKRGFIRVGYSKELGIRKSIGLVKYRVTFNSKDNNYQILYAIGRDIDFLIKFFIILIIIEFLIILKTLFKGSRVIRRTLKPLYELTETARNLNDEINIKNIEGVISSIDAERLDKRINIDSSQNELKDLAAAINNMLYRINESYQSQVRFVSDASHELRTPISVIQGYINLLDRWGKEDPKTLQESIDAIKDETNSMKDLVEQLLFLARGDNKTMEFHKEIFEACDVIEEIIKETQLYNLDLVFETNLIRPALIKGDKQLIKQALRILIDNGIKYSPKDEPIILRTFSEDNTVKIIVQDLGIGIPPEDLSHIFDRFYRSDESRARKTGGSGLGLSIAKWIVEGHEGHFEIISRLDFGTRITIVLPSV